MFKNKLINVILIIMVAMTLMGATAVVVMMTLNKADAEEKEPTIDEILETSFDTEEMTTNLLSDDYVRIKFKIIADSEEAKEELEKRDFQIRNLVIQELASMRAEDFKGKEGIINLQDQLKNKLNEVLKSGTIDQVYTTSFILQ